MLYFIGKSVKPARLERQKEKALKQNSPKSYKNESADRKDHEKRKPEGRKQEKNQLQSEGGRTCDGTV
ncbi:UNVERIFIED_ORG: hypothetical protein B5F06_09940 [Lacrimispora saccharolytica]